MSRIDEKEDRLFKILSSKKREELTPVQALVLGNMIAYNKKIDDEMSIENIERIKTKFHNIAERNIYIVGLNVKEVNNIVPTKEEIDIAMKLGTNYPYGPVEWCHNIGVKKIYSLLHELNKINSRYKPASFLPTIFK